MLVLMFVFMQWPRILFIAQIKEPLEKCGVNWNAMCLAIFNWCAMTLGTGKQATAASSRNWETAGDLHGESPKPYNGASQFCACYSVGAE